MSRDKAQKVTAKKKRPSHIKDLLPDPQNRRKHTPRNVGMIVDALHKVGTGRSIVIDETNTVLAGNATIEAAGEAGLTDLKIVDAKGSELVAVRRTGLSEAQKRDLALYDNRTAELAEWDVDQLLKDTEDGLDLESFFYEDELAELLETPGPDGGLTDPDTVPEPRVTDIKTGDLFTLGDHRLLCGDSTKAEDVARVMDGEKADMIQTDPPYGVAYSGASTTMLYGDVSKFRGVRGKSQRKIQNDDTTREATETLALALRQHTAAVAFVWHAPQFQREAKDAAMMAGYRVFSIIVWNKNNANWGALGSRYKPKYECALACVQDKIPWYGPNNETTVWDIDRASKNELHPTQKPVELFIRGIGNHTKTSERVFDPFAGSGTTIIAAEQLGRKCYAVEIDPSYCQVTIDRWEAFTGKTANKVT